MKKKVFTALCTLLTVTAMGSMSYAEDSFKIGFAQKDLSNEFQNALAQSLKDQCAEKGWECTVLNADSSIEQQMTDVETLIAGGYDLIILNPHDSEAGTSMAQSAMDAGIPVLDVDAEITDPSACVTIVNSPNYANGVEVGKFLTTEFGEDDEIIAAIISGQKGSAGGLARSEGELTGVLMGRCGMEEDAAHDKAKELYQELIDKGSVEYADAKLKIVGLGWGDWTEAGGLAASEDILTAHSDINCIMGENDSMLIGALQAVQAAGMEEQVRIYAADDAMKAALELIKEDGIYRATGLNAPRLVIEKAMDVATQILVDKADWDSFGDYVLTDPMCVSKENVDEYYDPDALF